MDRIVPTGTTPPVGTVVNIDAFGVGKHGWFDGDPVANVQGTIFLARFQDNVQEELLGVIEGAGIAPDANDNTQLRQAIALLNTSQIAYNASLTAGDNPIITTTTTSAHPATRTARMMTHR